MATLTVKNLTTSPVYLADLYVSVPASTTITTSRPVSALSAMASLQAASAAGTISVGVSYTATEAASGLVGEGLGAAVAAATGISDQIVLRIPLASGGSAGSADDTVVYALGKLPAAKLRILDMYAYVSTGVAASKIGLYTQTAAAGTLTAEVPTVATGRNSQNATVTASQVITNGGAVGLFLHRSDRSAVGEVVITLRPEQ